MKDLDQSWIPQPSRTFQFLLLPCGVHVPFSVYFYSFASSCYFFFALLLSAPSFFSSMKETEAAFQCSTCTWGTDWIRGERCWRFFSTFLSEPSSPLCSLHLTCGLLLTWLEPLSFHSLLFLPSRPLCHLKTHIMSFPFNCVHPLLLYIFPFWFVHTGSTTRDSPFPPSNHYFFHPLSVFPYLVPMSMEAPSHYSLHFHSFQYYC